METKKLIIVAVVGVAVGATATWFLRPPGESKVHTIDQVYKNDTKISTVSVYFKRETIKDSNSSKVKITKPDGTVIEREDQHTHEEDKTESGKTETQVIVKTEYVNKEVIKEVKVDAPKFSIGADIGYSFKTETPVYGVQAGYRLIGPLQTYVRGDTNQTASFGLRLEF